MEVFTSVLTSRIFAAGSLFILIAAGSLTASERLKPGELIDKSVDYDTPTLKIVVIAGQGGMNILDRVMVSPTTVQVVGPNDQPVAGAEVTFTLPAAGPGGVFQNGSHSLQVHSDDTGHARLTGMTLVGTGAFTLSISASFGDSNVSASITQTNYATAEAAAAANFKETPTAVTGARPAGLSSKAKVGIIAGIAAVALAGALVALNHGGGTSAGSAIPTASISLAGPATTGTPH